MKDAWGRGRDRGVILLSMMVLGSSSCAFLSKYKSAFVDKNYGAESATPPKLLDPDRMRLHATIEPLLVSTYEEPTKVAACFDAFAAPGRLEPLRKFGACLATVTSLDPPAQSGPSSPTACIDKAPPWDKCVFSSFDLVECSCKVDEATCAHPVADCDLRRDRMPDACADLSVNDRAHVLVSLAYAGEAIVSYDLQTLGSDIETGQIAILDKLTADREKAYDTAFHDSARILACDGTNSAADCTKTREPRTTSFKKPRAVLALSGGAANGAFMAGYLYELLQARNYAISHDATAKEEGFDAVIGTSVGALIAPMIDLAFVDAPVPAKALDWCNAQLTKQGAPPPKQKPTTANECALDLIEHYFNNVNEWDLLCAEDAMFYEFVAGAAHPPNKPSFGRFWPMERDIIRPFYEQFGDVLMKNDTVRIAMTTEVQTSTVQAQDERVCRYAKAPFPSGNQCSSGAQGELTGCLACGVLTSVPNPLFARPPSRGYSGTNDLGEIGSYLDGGLRSGFPVLRAVEMSGFAPDLTYVPVLGISTERAETAPETAPSNGFEMALDTIGQLVSQTHQWELAHATLYEQARRDRAKLLFSVRNPDGNHFSCIDGFASPSATLGNVFATFIPEDLGKHHLSIAGYQFDPLVMRGFFLTGRRMFLDQARSKTRNLLQYLKWPRTTKWANERVGDKSWLDTRHSEVLSAWHTWSAEFDKAELDWNAHLATRRDLMDKNLQICPY